MHEHLHKYFENGKKNWEKFFICNVRPLSICEPTPRPEGAGGFSSSSDRADVEEATKWYTCR